MNKFTFYNTACENPNQYQEHATWMKQRKDNKHFTCKLCSTTSWSLSDTGAEVLKLRIFGNQKTNKNGKSKHQINVNSFSARSKGQSKICFARASMTSVPSVEVAQIPQTRLINLQPLNIIFISQQILLAATM